MKLSVFSSFSLFIFISAFIIGGLSWYWYHSFSEKKCEEKYELINPNVPCGHAELVISKAGYVDLKRDLLEFIEEQTSLGQVNEVSVYFRDLNNGPVMGINETADFSPASLLKLPLAFLLYWQDENNPGYFIKAPKLVYAQSLVERTEEEKKRTPVSSNLSQLFPPPEEINPNTPYTVKELIRRLLTYSDNRANDVLIQHVVDTFGGVEAPLEIYRELGILSPETIDDETISVRGYSSIFRLLYHSSFLSPEHSEELLNFMSESTFTQGLRAGVPEDVEVAHKFGEREIMAQKNFQLHDCGIVYYPDNPYLICIMTKGSSMQHLPKIISEISRMVYEEVDSRRL